MVLLFVSNPTVEALRRRIEQFRTACVGSGWKLEKLFEVVNMFILHRLGMLAGRDGE